MRGFLSLAAILLSGALAACQQMIDSNWLPTSLNDVGSTCHSNAGTYHLPRRLLNVTVTTDATAAGYSIDVKNGDYAADRNETYCLDFLLSYLAEDKVGIQRTQSGLLERVYTKATDKTLDVAQSLIQAAADLVAADRAQSFGRAGAQKQLAGGLLASFQFDPFVEHEAREANIALREFGYCLFLDVKDDPFVPHWSPEICREITAPHIPPRRAKSRARQQPLISKDGPVYPRSGLAIIDPSPVPKEVQERGILYRPELSHSLIVMRKKDPDSRYSEWKFAGSERLVMPNAAPAFVLEVKRALFVAAETDVQFNKGLIKNVSIGKPSELLAFSNLTVAVAQIIVQIPARAFMIFENRAENTRELIRVNTELIDTLRAQKMDAEQNAQAREGTDLILGRSGGARFSGQPIDGNPATAKLNECLANPAVQQYSDPLRVCQEIVDKGL